MPLFQKSVVEKYLKGLNKDVLLAKWQQYQNHFLNPKVQEEIKGLKEEQYQGEFLEDLFVKILGYTKPASASEIKYNLTTEYKNIKDSKKADGAIIINDVVKAVIELKGTNTTDLGKIESQAFGYKNNQPECIYVITSNFEKLRFYIDNAIEHIEFNLFTLSEKEFELLYLCLAYDNIEKNIGKKIKEESISQEDVITKKLYRDYSLFKRELHQNLTELNPDYDPIELFKKSQKLIDRFLFLFFGEDRHLLPPNSVRLILSDWRDLQERDVEIPLYDRFKKYFEYLNIGYKGKRYDVFAYNGGLFKADEVLDVIKIDDELLYRHTYKLAEYDFGSEVDVNILGHIFENSLNELDEVKAQLEGTEIDKTKTRRKKDGVFYTPKYITKYIVENTIGKLCNKKKIELEITDEIYQAAKQRSRKRLSNLQDYRNWLLELTVCDPACGSGAFLNQALDFLIAEHRYIDELSAKYNKDTFVLSDVEKTILENNLFGVDLNEESVEIAKLSLWLRTAQPNRKLNDLNNNIKCGNSLIDDVEVAGDKAFNWQTEFPKIFDKGGFDVIIGNPPYVSLEKIKETSEALEKQKYFTFNKRGDLYCVFVEKGFDILKNNGIISYIMPNKWLQAGYGKNLREFFLRYNLIQLIDFGDMQIFEGATTYPSIFISKKSAPKKLIKISTLNKDIVDFDSNILINEENFEHSQLNSDTWVISSNNDKDIIQKIQKRFKTLNELTNGNVNRGIIPGLSEAFIINEELKNTLISKHHNSSELLCSILRGRDIKRYGVPLKDELDYIILASFGSYSKIENEYPAIHEYLLQFETRLKLRGQCSGSKETPEKPFTGQHHWLELDNNPTKDYVEQFLQPKIMYQVFQTKPCFIYDEQGLYCNNSMWIIPTEDKGLLGILNSKMGWWLIRKFCTQIQNGCQLIWKYFGQIPIANTTNELAILVSNMLALDKEHQEKSKKFQRTIQRKFELDELPKKLQDWYLLSYSEFIKELAKKKVKLSLSQEAEWEDYFMEESKKALELKATIDATDKAIDTMVYELYELNEEEIAIVENS